MSHYLPPFGGETKLELSSLLGIDASEDLLDKIFSSFCVGK